MLRSRFECVFSMTLQQGNATVQQEYTVQITGKIQSENDAIGGAVQVETS